jgi:ubiquinone/menaquinone biosynthesis C-methylase UbiE
MLKNAAISFLQKHPALHSFARRVYWWAKGMIAAVTPTRQTERQWRARPAKDIAADLDNLTHPHRGYLAEKIAALGPLSSALEIGCGYGANLYWLAKKFPDANLAGIDINPLSIAQGGELFRRKNSNVSLSVGAAGALDEFANKSYDVVFTDAVLLYVGPDKIKKVAANMLRIARKAVVLLEWYDKKDKKGQGLYRRGCWARNYKELFNNFVSKEAIQVEKIPSEAWPEINWQKYGYLITVVV